MTQPPPPGYPPSGYPAYPPIPPKHPQAVTVLVLGILCVVCGLCGPFAWSMGAKAEREIAAAPGRWSGDTEITIGKILGIVSTALLALTLVVLIVFVFGGVLAAGFSTN